MAQKKVKRQRKPSYIPKKLEVNGKEYKVTPRSVSWLYKNKAFGMCDPTSRHIEVAITKDTEENKGTLAHEFAHAYIKELEIKINKKWTEESMVKLFENIFTDLFNQLKH